MCNVANGFSNMETNKNNLQKFVESRVLGKLRSYRAGDKIESLLKATGVHQSVKAFERATGKECGCEERKRFLNPTND